MQPDLRKDIVNLIASEFPERHIMNLTEQLSARSSFSKNYANTAYSSPEIHNKALGQDQYFLVQQAAVDAAKNDNMPLIILPTKSPGGHFPKYSLKSFEIVVKRSVDRTAWERASYLKDLASLNTGLAQSTADLFDPQLENGSLSDRIFVILDVLLDYEGGVDCCFLVPSYDLKAIYTKIPFSEILDVQRDVHSDIDNIKPVSNLKKRLQDLDQDDQANLGSE
jgi:hypothetical protein